MNKRNVVLEELKKGAEPFDAFKASTQHYINIIMGETMPIGKADVPGLLTAVKVIDKVISGDNPEAAKIAGEACEVFTKCAKVVSAKAEKRKDIQKIYKKFFNAPQ